MSTPSILFVGDTLLETRDGSDPIEYVEEVWNQHDLIIMNLENPITETCTPATVKAAILFTSPAAVKWLARFRDKLLVCFSNNHIFDCGNFGYEETVRHLDEAGLRYCPLDSPFSTTISGTKVRIYALYREIQNDFQKSFSESDASGDKLRPTDEFSIAFCHWGDEYVLLPNPKIVKIATRLSKMGFRAIVGHHSHSAQGVSVRPDGCIISYSLGNFNFPDSLWLDPPGWTLPRLGYMLSLQVGSQPPVWVRRYYMIDKVGRPFPLALDFIDNYFKDLDKIQGKYQPLSYSQMYINYLSHSSRQILKSNLCYGWLPRVRKGGIKQFFLFLLWALNYRQIIRYPFAILKQDGVWKRHNKFLEEWSDYLESAPPELRKILAIHPVTKNN